jgi:hypothetical protein
MWEYQVNLDRNETKNIWLINDTYSIAQSFQSNVVLVNNGTFPFGPTPTPSVTPTNTPTISLTPTNTPTISVTPTNTPTNTPTPSVTTTNTPTVTPTVTPSVTATNTPTVTPTVTPSVTATNTPTVTPTTTNTPTVTPTITPTPTSTPQPAIFNVINNSTDVIVNTILYNGITLSYLSGNTLPISAGQQGAFRTFQTGSNLQLSISYSSTTAGQSVTLSHPFGDTCDNLLTGSNTLNSFTFTLQPTQNATLTFTGTTC